MKTSMVVLATLILCAGATVYGQEKTEKKESMGGMMQNRGGAMGMQKGMMHDGVVMNGGKMMVVKGGKSTVMKKNVMLSNGSTVMPDGKVVMKDGKTMMMKEGEMMDMAGTVTKQGTGTMMKGMMSKEMPMKRMMRKDMMKKDTMKKDTSNSMN